MIRLFFHFDEGGEDAITRAVELASLAPEQVRLALRYYANYPDEIPDWIQIVDEEAERAQTKWEGEQALLRR